MKINENHELEWDRTCWILYEWYDGHKKAGGKLVPERKKSIVGYYSDLTAACRAVLDRSAGIACQKSEDLMEAIEQADIDILDSIGARAYRYAWE